MYIIQNQYSILPSSLSLSGSSDWLWCLLLLKLTILSAISGEPGGVISSGSISGSLENPFTLCLLFCGPNNKCIG
jgi:hypothetical protein